MSQIPVYPFRFEPIFESNIWGGRGLSALFDMTLPGEGPIGEAWILSDRHDHPSRVANGPLKGRTIEQLLDLAAEDVFGDQASRFNRFPLLLKFLDAEKMLSVQVHPSDAHGSLIPCGETAKTEAWVVLEASRESRVFAGVRPGTTADDLAESSKEGTVSEHLASFTPVTGDAFFLPAGIVHSLGGGTIVFEIQQNSDVTFRLYDWGHVDAATGRPRPLQVAEALECTDLSMVGVGPVTPLVKEMSPVERERVFCSEHFVLWRLRGKRPFAVGAADAVRVLVCIGGAGQIEKDLFTYEVRMGDVFLLPAMLGTCDFRPRGEVTLLEISIPEGATTGPQYASRSRGGSTTP